MPGDEGEKLLEAGDGAAKGSEAARLIEAAITDARATGQDTGIQWSQWVSALLDNSLGRYEMAQAQAQQAAEQSPELFISAWALPELIEAASRTGQTRLAADALSRLAEATSIGQTDWGLGTYARCRALLGDGEDAEGWYREAIERLSRTRLRPELARAHLLYGEWLRRESRRGDAREQLRTAHDRFDAIGMEAFAERARRELRATGETIHGRAAGTHDQLTPQEDQIARLARAGLSNPEIATQLFLSARTVQYHLRKVFTKLEISSRHQLQQALSDGATAGPMTRLDANADRVKPPGSRGRHPGRSKGCPRASRHLSFGTDQVFTRTDRRLAGGRPAAYYDWPVAWPGGGLQRGAADVTMFP